VFLARRAPVTGIGAPPAPAHAAWGALMRGIIQSWGRILTGYTPSLSIEVTRECPLRCPGCYAYGSDHLGGSVTLRELSDYKGQALIDGVLALVDRHRPVHVSLVGGEPLVRFRELDVLLPRLSERGLHVQVVTSAVRPIPESWARIARLSVVVSIDGLAAEHDVRRAPATYDRILKHIAGHRIVVHCTVTRQQANRAGYLREFTQFWSDQSTVRKIWFSLYTPQVGEESDEKLRPEDRLRVVADLLELRERFPKVEMPRGMIQVYADPPTSPEDCIFARVTRSVSADLQTRITPCQFGGTPDCANCGCIASAGLEAIGRHRLGGFVRIDPIFDASIGVGRVVQRWREGRRRDTPPAALPQPGI
jgi:sulfatase maturation enzyme AslB (radical SAM superfamily)